MSNEIFKIIFEEFKKNGIKINDFEYRGDTFVADPLDIVNFPILRGEDMRPLLDFSEHDKPFEDKIASLENQIAYMKEKKSFLRTRCTEDAIDAFDKGSYGALTIVGRRGALEAENKELKQRIAELESEKSENCEEEPISDDARPSAEWYENRYQQDCITINRLNTTIDVLIHKIEYLRQFAGLE